MEAALNYILLLISITLFSIGTYRLIKYTYLQEWIKTKASILSVNETWRDVAISEYTVVKYYYPKIEYEYSVNDKHYKSNNVSSNVENIWICEVDDFGVETKNEKMFWRSLNFSDTIDIYINPDNHEESVIISKLNTQYKSHNLALLVSGTIIFALWFYL